MNKIKILFLAANPMETSRLQLDEEVRSITEKIRASEYRDSIEFITSWAVRPDDLLQELNIYKPHIVHFSGHGSRSGKISLSSSDGSPKAISIKALNAVFSILKDNIRLVVFNACHSYTQAKVMTEVIDCAIGMNDAIVDKAACLFAASLYRGIGFGRSIQDAFDQGIASLLLEGVPGEDIPILATKPGVNASQVSFLNGITAVVQKRQGNNSSSSSEPHSIPFSTCVISYAQEDKLFAEQLYEDLQKNGVRCWFAQEDLRTGDKIRSSVDKAIKRHDKLLVILSKHSMRSPWMEKEVETAFEEEQLRNNLILFPIRLDDAVMKTKQSWASDIRRMRVIGDFQEWSQDMLYQRALARLLRDLKMEG